MAGRLNGSKRGFTLIELVIVIAVIAILAALLVPTILGQAERARISRAAGEVNEIGKALARLRTDAAVTGSLAAYQTCLTLPNLLTSPNGTACPPNTGGAMPACSGVSAGTPCWGGPYLASVPTNDPWNRGYVISVLTVGGVATGQISVSSAGPDGTAGTSDDSNLSKNF
jgi:general secretion pathway protein G